MSGWVVADLGIFIAIVLEEKYSSNAEALAKHWFQQEIQIAAPALFHYEIVATMRKSVYRNIIQTTEAIRYRDILLAQPVQLMIDNDLLRRVFELATQFNRPTAYDSQYLAVAERLKCEFWTADEKMFNAVGSELNWVKWLGNFEV